MTQILAKQLVRQGNLEDLPILSPGEFGYAVDVKRLFIGNEPQSRSATDQQTEFNFGIDLDQLPGQAYRILVNGNDQSYSVSNYVITFSQPLDENDVVEFEHNSELLTYAADKGDDSVQSQEIPAGYTGTLAAVAFDTTQTNTINISYSVVDSVNTSRFRKGTIGIIAIGSAATIEDNYTTSSEDIDWDHEFSVTVTEDILVLNVTTTSANNCIFKWIANSFKS